eukprot:s510_g1.t1
MRASRSQDSTPLDSACLQARWQRVADVPVYLKGIQSAEDALQAVAMGVKGIVVSNHGGRACGNAIGHSFVLGLARWGPTVAQ